LIVYIDGGWDFSRSLGYASVYREGIDDEPLVFPIFNPQSSSCICEFEALVYALTMTPDSEKTHIYGDAQTVINQVIGNIECGRVELFPYAKWAKRKLGNRKLIWIPRAQNKAHVNLKSIFLPDDLWEEFELRVLRVRGRKRKA